MDHDLLNISIAMYTHCTYYCR